MKRVMLVEDEEFILQGILCINDWASMDMEVAYLAHNGKEALEIFKEDPVDIVVTDVEMPLMNGLNLIREIRDMDSRVRFLILSGYDEFEYARSAMGMDVEEYILKPINEEQLGKALIHAALRLDEMDRKQAMSMEDKIGWIQFLEGEAQGAFQKPPELLGLEKLDKIYPALMKVDLDTLRETNGVTPILVELQKQNDTVKTIYLKMDVLLLLLYCGEETTLADAQRIFGEIQNHLESENGIMSFLAIGQAIHSYDELPDSYGHMNRLLRYRVMMGCGRYISEESILLKNTDDIVIDEAFLRKKILEKDQDGALQYIENLFINITEAETDIDVLYQSALKVVLLLQDIKEDYKIMGFKDVKRLSEMFDRIYQAEDIFVMRTALVLEISAVIMALHTEDSSYTPVIREILNYVQKNYSEDISLKVLSYKYHMNASYLGQIFQKEVGCFFNQYLSSIKNEKAKEMILNTNMKINDIAQKVGYLDTSYFYKKFKQCYGVSPASLRNMKKY